MLLDTATIGTSGGSANSYCCQAFNGNASFTETLTATARCCRVPGR